MPIPWPALFKALPWTQLVAAAPAILEQAKKLVVEVRRKDIVAVRNTEFTRGSEPSPDSLSVIKGRLSHVEARIEEVADEAVASAVLLKSLAEQNAQLMSSLQVVSSRVRRLTWACIVLASVLGGVIFWE